MIEIGKPTICSNDEKAVLEAEVHISEDIAKKYKKNTNVLINCPWRTDIDYPPKAWKNGDSKLRFEVDKKYEDCLCYERSDAFVIALLWYAIITGEDISFEVPMSKRLYSGLTESLIPALCSDQYKRIKLLGPVTSEKLECKGGIGTGMTFGVDSFYTFKTHELTHLAIYEYGVVNVCKEKLSVCDYYQKDNDSAENLFALVKDFAKKNGLEFLYVKTNLDKNFYRGGIIYRGMYACLSCTLAVQKLFKTYISSSSGNGGDLQVGVISPTQNYENLICDSCKTETLDYISSDNTTRFDKIKKLADDNQAKQLLEVCFDSTFVDKNHKREKNCGECFGCVKTMIVLDLLGKLDGFENVFDLKKYYSDRRRYIKILADGTLRPEQASARAAWYNIVQYASSHNSELADIILELDGDL